MLTRARRLELERRLKTGMFVPEDFQVTERSIDNKTGVTLKYRYSPDYVLEATFDLSPQTEEVTETEQRASSPFAALADLTPKTVIRRERQRQRYIARMTPGEIGYSEERAFDRWDSFLSLVTEWVGSVQDELEAATAYRETIKNRKDVEDFIESKAEPQDDEPLTTSDVEGLRERLDELEKALRAQLERAAADRAEVKRQLDELHAAVAFVKSHVGGMTRRNAKGLVTARLFQWLRKDENRKLLRDTAAAAAVVSRIVGPLLSAPSTEKHQDPTVIVAVDESADTEQRGSKPDADGPMCK